MVDWCFKAFWVIFLEELLSSYPSSSFSSGLTSILDSFLRVCFSSNRTPSMHGLTGFTHFLHAELHLVLKCCSSKLEIMNEMFLGFLGLKLGKEDKVIQMTCSDTDMTSSFSSRGEV